VHSVAAPNPVTANNDHFSDGPFSAWLPRSANMMPDPVTRSLTVRETRISAGRDRAPDRLPGRIEGGQEAGDLGAQRVVVAARGEAQRVITRLLEIAGAGDVGRRAGAPAEHPRNVGPPA
jgi:hypothetical protein